MRRNKNPKTNAGASDAAEATASRKQKPTMAMLKEPPPPGTQNRRRRCWKSHPFPETSRTTTIERCDAETYVDQETPNKSQMLKRKKELHNRTDGGSESLAVGRKSLSFSLAFFGHLFLSPFIFGQLLFWATFI